MSEKQYYIANGKSNPDLKDFIQQVEEKLKSCPFCGERAEIENTHTPSYWVECTGCDCQIGDPVSHEMYDDIDTHKSSILNAAKAWNTRVKKKSPTLISE